MNALNECTKVQNPWHNHIVKYYNAHTRFPAEKWLTVRKAFNGGSTGSPQRSGFRKNWCMLLQKKKNKRKMETGQNVETRYFVHLIPNTTNFCMLVFFSHVLHRDIMKVPSLYYLSCLDVLPLYQALPLCKHIITFAPEQS